MHGQALVIIADDVAVTEHALFQSDDVHVIEQPLGLRAAIGVGVHQNRDSGNGLAVVFPCFKPEIVPCRIGDGEFFIQRLTLVGLAITGGSLGTLHKYNALAQWWRQGIHIFTESLNQPEESLFVFGVQVVGIFALLIRFFTQGIDRPVRRHEGDALVVDPIRRIRTDPDHQRDI